MKNCWLSKHQNRRRRGNYRIGHVKFFIISASSGGKDLSVTAMRMKTNSYLRFVSSWHLLWKPNGSGAGGINKMAGSWTTYPQLAIYLWIQDVHEHDPRFWIHTPWTTDTKRARSSHTTRRKRSNKKRSAYGSCTVPRSMLGFIRNRMDWWFDGTITTENSKFLRRE